MSSFDLLYSNMIFKNRKRVVLDRGPSWPDYDKAEPFMVRYYLLFRKRPKWFPFNIFVHQILKSDRGDLHDHYWSYLTIVVKGGYWKQGKTGLFGEGLAISALEKAQIDIV